MIILLALCGILIIAAGFVIIGTLVRSIPPMPSNSRMRARVIELLHLGDIDSPVIELGSGWGGLSRRIALTFPNRPVAGLEISLMPFLWSRLLQSLSGPGNLRIRRRNVIKEPLNAGSTYICYLSTIHMTKLMEKINAEGFKGVFISMAFALPRTAPDRTFITADFYQSRIYYYVFG
jgi:hypothetical protein